MKIKKIAITGNIGSGKSLICKIFNNLGINTFHSDEETKKLYLQNFTGIYYTNNKKKPN